MLSLPLTFHSLIYRLLNHSENQITLWPFPVLLMSRLGLRSGFESPGLDRPGRLPHQQGLCEARLGRSTKTSHPNWGPRGLERAQLPRGVYYQGLSNQRALLKLVILPPSRLLGTPEFGVPSHAVEQSRILSMALICRPAILPVSHTLRRP